MSQYYPPQQPSQQHYAQASYPNPQQSGQSGYGWPPQQSFYPPQSPPAQLEHLPPMTPQYPNREPERKKTSKTWLWIIIALFIGMIVGYGIHTPGGTTSTTNNTTATTQQTTVATQAVSQPTPAPTQKPTAAPKWVTTQSFTGNGTKKTGYFTVPNDWKLVWKCNPASFFGGSYNVIVSVTGSDGTPIDPTAVNTLCQRGNTGDSTDEHQGGQVYLDVTSEGAWSIQVQELK